MNYATSISPTDLRDYAKVRGWVAVPEAMSRRLVVLGNPKAKFRQLIVPLDTDSPDYNDAMRVAITNLSELEERPFAAVEASLMEAGSDTLRLGVSTMRHLEDGLPLSYAVRAFEGAEKALRAAACSEVQRQPFHPKLNRAEAQRLVEAAQMRHTERGSFVLKIACPVDAVPADEPELLDRPPFARRALLGMSGAVHGLVAALESDTLEQLIVHSTSAGGSALSANLCDALLAYRDDELRANLDFSIAWSARLDTPALEHQRRIRIQWDYFARIEQVRAALRPAAAPSERTFVGMVDELKGDLDSSEQREGEVILALLVDKEVVRAKAFLDVHHHRVAHQAYGQGKTYVKVTGLLHPGNMPRRLTQVRDFVIVENTATAHI